MQQRASQLEQQLIRRARRMYAGEPLAMDLDATAFAQTPISP